jgi:broad specificity phosphatase PhoE
MHLHLIRHGKRDHQSNSDPGLSPTGRAEAERLAAALAAEPIAAVYSSPLARARETAAIIAAAMDFPVVEDARLRERMNWGDVPGQSFDEFITEWERCSLDRDYQPRGGDSSRAAGQRLEAFVIDCQQRAVGGAVVAVTHGGVIADFLRNVFTQEALERVRPAFCRQPYSAAVIPECSMTTVVYDGARYRLEMLGSLRFEPVE